MKTTVAVKRVESEFWKGVTVGMSIIAAWVAWLC
jgi:hypothetical protein